MPTLLPRINVTVTEEQHDLLGRLADVYGGSRAGHLREMLDTNTKALRAIVEAMERAQEQREQAERDISEGMAAALGEVLSDALHDEAQADWERAMRETARENREARSGQSPASTVASDETL